MPGRIVALMLGLVHAGNAHAHALDAQAFLLPGCKVQIEAWFSTGTPARGAQVQLVRGDGQVLAEASADDQGTAVLPLAEAGTFRVVVSAGIGHRKELTIVAGTTERVTPLADRSAGLPVKEIVAGMGFVLALAAFLLGLRNARRLRALEARLASNPSQAPRGEGCRRDPHSGFG